MRKVIRLFIICILVIVSWLFSLTPVFAQVPTQQQPLNTNYAFGNLISLGSGVSLIVTAAIIFFSIAVVFYLVIAGIKFIVSEGDKASVSEAKKTITHTLIAILLFILLFLIIKYIPPALGLSLQIIP